jgi:hypothetical protein
MAGSIHEQFSRNEVIEGSSDRSFGFVFTVLFFVLALSPMRKGRPMRVWMLVVSALFLLVSLIAPALLAPLNKVWTRFALLLGKITTPMVLGLVFYGVFTPAGYLLRLFNWDPLRLKKNPAGTTFWIAREPSTDSAAESMKHMF